MTCTAFTSDVDSAALALAGRISCGARFVVGVGEVSPMTREREPGHARRTSAVTAPGLEDLISLAVMIAAGCEPCADRMVRRALQRGSAKASIARTLEIVGHLRALDCFLEAVGSQVIARMEKPLQAAQMALDRGDLPAEGRICSE